MFYPCLLWPDGWMDQDVTCSGGKPRPRRRYVRRGRSSPLKGHSSQFSAHVYCGHGRPSQLLLSSCTRAHVARHGKYRQLQVVTKHFRFAENKRLVVNEKAEKETSLSNAVYKKAENTTLFV